MPNEKMLAVPQLPPAARQLGHREVLNETFESAHGEVEYLRLQGAAVAYKLGERLCTMRDLKLYQAGGFQSFSAYLDALKGASRRTYYRCIARYEAVDRRLGEVIDAERLDLAARLLPHRRGADVLVTPKSLKKLEVSVDRDGRRQKVFFHAALTTELIGAARRRKTRVVPESEQEQIERFAKKFSEHVHSVKPAKAGKKAAVAVIIPLDKLAAFEKLLRK